MENNKKNESAEWNFEAKRRERDERKEKMGSGEDKKPLRDKSRSGRILLRLLVALLIVSVIGWGVFALGLPQKWVYPITVGDEKISVAEYNYFYNAGYQQFQQYAQQGIIPRNPQGNADLNVLSPLPTDEGLTWGEVLERNTRTQVQRLLILDQEAKKAGIELSAEAKQKIEDQIASARKNFGSALDAENALIKAYGRGVTLDVLRGIMTRIALADEYGKSALQKKEVTTEEAEKYYAEHKNDYDTVTFRSFTFRLPPESEEQQKMDPKGRYEMTAKDLDKLKESVDLFVKGLTTEEQFIQRAKEFAPVEEKAQYDDPDRTLVREAPLAQLAQQPSGAFFAKEDLKPGQVEIIPGPRYYQVMFFISRQRPEELLPTIGRMSFRLNGVPTEQTAEATEARKKAMEALKAAANESLEKVSDEATLRAEEKRQTEAGQTVQMNWLENVQVSRMQKAERDWLEQPGRKTGDKTLILTEDSAVILVYGEAGKLPAWQQAVEMNLRSKAFADELTALAESEAYAIQASKLGMHFVHRLGKNTLTGAEVKAKIAATSEPAATATATATAAATTAETTAVETTAPTGTTKYFL